MEVLFATRRSKVLFESKAELVQAYGESCARKVMARLADLRAAPTLEEFRQLPGHCQELDQDRSGQLALKVADDKLLIFEPIEKTTLLRDDDKLDWCRVDAVCVMEILDDKRDRLRLERARRR